MHLPYFCEMVSYCNKHLERSNLLRRWNLHLTGITPTICHLKLVSDVMLCKDRSKKLKIVSFGCRECMLKLLRFGSFLRSFLLASMASNVYN